MVRVISQDTYDDLVKENIDEFDMTPEEAIKEAISQLEAQGVDLSNIIKDLAITSKEEHLVTAAITKLKKLNNGDKTFKEIAEQLMILKVECEKDIAYKLKAGKDGAYVILLDLLEYYLDKNEENASILILETMNALMDQQPDLLEERGAMLIKRILDGNTNENILVATLKWASSCCLKHEKNRQTIFENNIVYNIKRLLRDRKNITLLTELFQLIRRLCLDDDVRVEFGKAHEHARDIAVNTLDLLVKLLKDNTKPPLVSEIMLTMATVMVRHEFCQTVGDAGGAEVLVSIFGDNFSSNSVVQQAFKLVTALAGNDDVKRQLMKSGIAPLVVLVINNNMNQQTTVALGLKCISSLCLRESSHSVMFFENGAHEVIAEAMNKYPNSSVIQKNACWAIRNMVARCKDRTNKFLELGVEQYLNKAYENFHQEFGFDIKSALRDLECDVKLQEQWTGKGVQMQND